MLEDSDAVTNGAREQDVRRRPKKRSILGFPGDQAKDETRPCERVDSRNGGEGGTWSGKREKGRFRFSGLRVRSQVTMGRYAAEVEGLNSTKRNSRAAELYPGGVERG